MDQEQIDNNKASSIVVIHVNAFRFKSLWYTGPPWLCSTGLILPNGSGFATEIADSSVGSDFPSLIVALAKPLSRALKC